MLAPEHFARWTRLSEAASLAFHIHAEQLRKGTTIPYVSHLLGVTSTTLEHGGDEEQACAALLHDAIEEGGTEWEGGDSCTTISANPLEVA